LNLKFKAQDSISQSTLDSLDLNATFINYLNLKKEVDALHNTLETNGFIENEMRSLQKKNDSTYIALYHLGPKYKSIQLFYLEKDFSKKELLQVSKKVTESYFVLPFNTIASSITKLNTLKTESGNAFARIKLENITKKKNRSLSANIILLKGVSRTIDSIKVKGYEKFSKSHIKHYAGIKKENKFNKSKLIEKSNILNSLGFVSVTKPPEILFKKDSTIVYLYLKKEKNNLFDGILGFATNEDSQKLIFNGYLNLELNNNLNFGEQFLLNYKADGNDQQNFKAKLTVPYLFKTPFGLITELKIFKRDSTFSTSDQLIKVRYQINTTSKSYIGFKGYESSNLRKDNSTNVDVEDYTSKFILVGLSYTKAQNNILFPIKSIFHLDTEIGSREYDNANESQIRASLLLHTIFNLNYKNSIYLKNNTELLNSESYFTNELFRFGGINSIRGFNENSIDASFYSVLNSEYRYQINQDIYVHSIIDFAYFENEIIVLKQKLYSFGIGIGLQTTAGIIKFSIANGNTENQDFNFSNTKIHISILSKF
jgi:outer membrane protein assembly factor BamA|tara:strand:- start:3896 stop:5518 length:1623 start_codon:yes stop_codon:yes gene_type:complete